MPLPADPRGRELYLMVSRDAYERWVAREIETILRGGFQEVTTQIVTRYGDLTPFQKQRALTLFAQTNKLLAKSYGEASTFSQNQIKDYTRLESDIARAQLRSTVTGEGRLNMNLDAMAPARVKAIAELPIAGLPLGEWWETQARDMSINTRRQIQMGLLQGETPQQITRRILPSDATTPATFRQARNSARTLVRTSVTSVQGQAALETYKSAGDRVTDSYQYIVVRDARTSSICRALSNKIFLYNDPKKKVPPQHPNCRSTIVAVVNYEKLGLTRPKADGPLSFQSYASWLDEQSFGMQSEILGPARAKLYAAGRVSLEELISSDNRTLTLDQLRDRILTRGVLEQEQIRVSTFAEFRGVAANPEAPTTLARFTQADGRLTPERQAIHDEIVREYLAGMTPEKNPIIRQLGGGPSSGKSVLTNTATPIPRAITIDPDEIRTKLPEYYRMTRRGDRDASSFTHDEASMISKRLQREAVANKTNFVMDNVGGGDYDDFKKKISGYRANGARVVANYVSIDTELAMERMILRAQQPGPSFKRFVPEDYLRDAHASVSRVFSRAVQDGLFDEFVLWDNTGKTPVKIVSGRAKNLKIHNNELWQAFLRKGG